MLNSSEDRKESDNKWINSLIDLVQKVNDQNIQDKTSALSQMRVVIKELQKFKSILVSANQEKALKNLSIKMEKFTKSFPSQQKDLFDEDVIAIGFITLMFIVAAPFLILFTPIGIYAVTVALQVFAPICFFIIGFFLFKESCKQFKDKVAEFDTKQLNQSYITEKDCNSLEDIKRKLTTLKNDSELSEEQTLSIKTK